MTCPQHDTVVTNISQRFDSIDAKLKTIDEKLGDGKISFATILLRVRALEVVVYGACSVGLLAIAGAIITMVVK